MVVLAAGVSAVANGETRRRSRRLEAAGDTGGERPDRPGPRPRLARTGTTFAVTQCGRGGPAGARRTGPCSSWTSDGLVPAGGRQPPAAPGPARTAAADGATLSLRRLNRRYEPPVPLGPDHLLGRRRVPFRRADQLVAPLRPPVRGDGNDQGVRGDRARRSARGGLLRVVHGARRDRGGAASGSQGCRQVSPAGRLAGPPRGGCPPRRARPGRGPSPGRVRQIARAVGSDRLSRSAGARRDTTSADFYLHLVPDSEASPTDDLHLSLLMKDIRRTLAGT